MLLTKCPHHVIYHLVILKLSRCHAGETTEVFGEKRGISKVHLFGYLRCSILMRVMRARSIQSLAVVPLVWRMTVLR